MKVLLTGNTGGIGKHIQRKLMSSGVDVVGINTQNCNLSNLDDINSSSKRNQYSMVLSTLPQLTL